MNRTLEIGAARAHRVAQLHDALDDHILIIDGAMGTMIQRYGLDEADYRGTRFADHPSSLKGANDLLCLTRPDIIQAIHKAYLDAGAEVLETNSFNANHPAMADYDLEHLVFELNEQSARRPRGSMTNPKTLNHNWGPSWGPS